ncbi:MAG: hypothetical protein Q8M94_12550 [Ignavibacteria bacterium]|nr:hypothetical protein [Ignavibacteria bacterium]
MLQNEKEKLLRKDILDVIQYGLAESFEDRILYNTKFELKPRDFLLLAEQSIFFTPKKDLINGVSNLKRAIDCSLDSFFNSLGILTKIKKKRVSVSDKMEFIGSLANFTPQSIKRLNKTRNQLEHDFKRPKLAEAEVYYDLVFALVLVIENLCFMHSEMNFDDGSSIFTSQYNVHTGTILFSKIQPDENLEKNLGYSFQIGLNDGIPLFMLGLKCHRALSLLTDKIFTIEEAKKYLELT